MIPGSRVPDSSSRRVPREKVFRAVRNRVLQLMARFLPGYSTLRVTLHRWRGVRIGEGVSLGHDIILETAYPHWISIGNNVQVSIRSMLIAHSHSHPVPPPGSKEQRQRDLETAEALLLERSSASAGQVIDEKRISLLPLSDGNPFVLSRLVPGVAYVGELKFSRPFDNAGTSSINADGSSGGNEFTLDGSPNMASGRRVAFVPPAGAVQEFKVQTGVYSAEFGRATSQISATTKSGANQFHGTVFEFLRNSALDAREWRQSDGKKNPFRRNQYGFTLGGRLVPNKVFFLANEAGNEVSVLFEGHPSCNGEGVGV